MSPEGPARAQQRRDVVGLEGMMRDAVRGAADEEPLLPWNFEVTPAIDRQLNALAVAGRTDPGARNRLYDHLRGKIARFIASWCRYPGAFGTAADVQQEAFLVFAGLVADWPGHGSFARYFFGFFPWRLRHVSEALTRRWPRDRLVVVPHDVLEADVAAPDDPPDPLLMLGPFTPDEARLVALHVGADLSLPAVARLLGWSRRTAYRRWAALAARLAAEGGLADVVAQTGNSTPKDVISLDRTG